MKKRAKGLSCGENALPYTQEHEGGDPINGETSLREMAGELPAVEDGWREVGFLLVDLSLNIVMTEGDIKEKSEAGEKCYRLLHGRRAPCRKCAAAETFRDGAPRSVICERGRGRTKVRCAKLQGLRENMAASCNILLPPCIFEGGFSYSITCQKQ